LGSDNAAVGISGEDSAFLVHSDVVEVEKISVVTADQSAEADRSPLDWIGRA
jgi:hypothetical protein